MNYVNFVMRQLINKLDKIIRWTKKASDKETVLKYLATIFESNIKYTEKEINRIIDRYNLFNEIPLLGRELVSRKLLGKIDDGLEYWKIY